MWLGRARFRHSDITPYITLMRTEALASEPSTESSNKGSLRYEKSSLHPQEFYNIIVHTHTGWASKPFSAAVSWLLLGLSGFALNEVLSKLVAMIAGDTP